MEVMSVYSADTMFPGTTLIIVALGGLILAGIWAVLASTRMANGQGERNDRIPLFYGYSVCLISLLWALTSVGQIADGVLSLGAPDIRTGFEYGPEPSVSSFEAFRSTYDQARRMSQPYPPTAQLDSVPEAELRKRYEVLRADRIRRGEFMARKTIISKTLSLILAAGLFAFHWRWLKRHQVART